MKLNSTSVFHTEQESYLKLNASLAFTRNMAASFVKV